MFLKYFVLIFTLLLPTIIFAEPFNFPNTKNLNIYLERVAKHANNLSSYLTLILDANYKNKNVIELQDHSVIINFKKFDKKTAATFYAVFDVYCKTVGGVFSGGEYKIGNNEDGVSRNYIKNFTCLTTDNNELFKSETDGTYFTQLTFIKIVFTPVTFKNLENAVNKMKLDEAKNTTVIGFYGNYKDRYIVYEKQKRLLTYRFTYADKSQVFLEDFDSLIGTLKQPNLGTSAPVYNPNITSIEGEDCMIKPGNKVFIYPAASCVLEFKDVTYPALDLETFESGVVSSLLGKFKLYPMYKE